MHLVEECLEHILIYSQKSHTSKQSEVARKTPTTEETDSLKLKKAWELAIAPAKQLPMNAIGMMPQFHMDLFGSNLKLRNVHVGQQPSNFFDHDGVHVV